MALGNAVGGIGLVTVLRLIQVGRNRVEFEQRRPPATTGRPGSDPEPPEPVLAPRP